MKINKDETLKRMMAAAEKGKDFQPPTFEEMTDKDLILTFGTAIQMGDLLKEEIFEKMCEEFARRSRKYLTEMLEGEDLIVREE